MTELENKIREILEAPRFITGVSTVNWPNGDRTEKTKAYDAGYADGLKQTRAEVDQATAEIMKLIKEKR